MLYGKGAALIVAAALLLISASGRASADAIPGAFVLVAELEIDSSEVEAFKAAITERGETAVRVEPGPRVQCSLRKGKSDTGLVVRNLHEFRCV
jgi:hypothetical protein